jgi:hypothetical protein
MDLPKIYRPFLLAIAGSCAVALTAGGTARAADVVAGHNRFS